MSVPGWSGPSLALSSLSVSSYSGIASAEPAGVLVGRAEVVHGGERVGVVGAQLGLLELERLLEQQHRLGEPAGGLVGQRGCSWW